MQKPATQWLKHSEPLIPLLLGYAMRGVSPKIYGVDYCNDRRTNEVSSYHLDIISRRGIRPAVFVSRGCRPDPVDQIFGWRAGIVLYIKVLASRFQFCERLRTAIRREGLKYLKLGCPCSFSQFFFFFDRTVLCANGHDSIMVSC